MKERGFSAEDARSIVDFVFKSSLVNRYSLQQITLPFKKLPLMNIEIRCNPDFEARHHMALVQKICDTNQEFQPVEQVIIQGKKGFR